jgi:hypothetical protein
MNILMSVMIFTKISSFFLQKRAGGYRRSKSQDLSQKPEVGPDHPFNMGQSGYQQRRHLPGARHAKTRDARP